MHWLAAFVAAWHAESSRPAHVVVTQVKSCPGSALLALQSHSQALKSTQAPSPPRYWLAQPEPIFCESSALQFAFTHS
jgi:hypothetical protein